MQVSYDIKAEDFVAFNLNFMKNDPVMQKRLRLSQMAGAVLIVLAVAAYSIFYGFSLPIVGIGLLLAVLFVFYIPWSVKSSVQKSVTRVLRDSAKTACGQKTLTLEADKLHLTGEGEDGLYEYKNVARVITDEHHYFIYTGAMEALILPFRAFEGEADRMAYYSCLCDKVTEAGGAIG